MASPMSNDGYEEYKVDDVEAQEYLEKEKLLTEALNKCLEKWKGFIEHKYETYYYTGKVLYELWMFGRFRSVRQMCNELYSIEPDEYKKDFTPSVLKNCYYFYDYVSDLEKIWKRLQELSALYKGKEGGKLSQSGTLTMSGFLEGKVKSIEEEVLEIFNTLREVFPAYYLDDVDTLMVMVEPIKKFLKKPLTEVVGFRVLWEAFHECVPKHLIVEIVKRGSPYKNKTILEPLRREFRELGTRKRKILPLIVCHLCGKVLEWDEKDVSWKHVPVCITCLKEYLERASEGKVKMIIEDMKMLKDLLDKLIEEYNIEEIGEGEE